MEYANPFRLRKHLFLFLMTIVYLLMSCSPASDSFQTEELPSPESLWRSTITPSPTSAVISVMPPLLTDLDSDLILIGYGHRGTYLTIEPKHATVNTVVLPQNCRIMNPEPRSVCEGSNGLYLIDLRSGQQTDIPVPASVSWTWTPDHSIIFFEEEGEDGKIDMFAHYIETGVTKFLGSYRLGDWVVSPRLSARGEHLIYAEDTVEHPSGTLFELTSDGIRPIEIGQVDWYVTDLAWSPTSQILGVGATDLRFDDPVDVITRYFMLYDAGSDEIIKIAEAPSGYVYSHFYSYSYPNNIWSPTGSQVALTAFPLTAGPPPLSTPLLCLIDIQTRIQDCLDVVEPGASVYAYAWSPDSQSIAFVEIDTEYHLWLNVLSAEDRSVALRMEINISLAEIDELVWIGP